MGDYLKKTTRNNNESASKSHILRAIRMTMRQFCQHTTLHGYKYLIDCKRSTAERCVWFVLLTFAFVFAVALTLHSYVNYVASPTVTSLQSQRHPVWEVPFPTISICNINRISKQAAKQYAEELVAKSQHLNLSGTMRQMRYFGRLYDYSEENFNDLLEFQSVLDQLDDMTLGVFDVRYRLYQLSPKCSDILIKCQWEGHDADCNDIFSTRLTGEGYCCTFNNIRPRQTLSFAEVTKPLRTCFTGPSNGLTVLLNTSTADYFYPIKNNVGYSVAITSPSVFADEASGHVHRIIVPGRTEAFVSLNVRTVKASAEVEYLKKTRRACMFEHELPSEYGGHYSFNDCLTKCKIRNYVALCGCIPFNLPTNFPDFSDDLRQYFPCNLGHLKCLHQFKITFSTFRPTMDGSQRVANAVQCPDCLPMCSGTTYEAQTTFSRIVTRSFRRNSWGIMRNVTRVNNVSIVRIFYPYVTSMLYTTNVLYTWQEMIAFYGGTLGLCVGFSIVGFMEIVYFCTFRLARNIFCPPQQSQQHNQFNDLPSYKQVEQSLLANRMKASRDVEKNPKRNS